jgi:hypothetical protein
MPVLPHRGSTRAGLADYYPPQEVTVPCPGDRGSIPGRQLRCAAAMLGRSRAACEPPWIGRARGTHARAGVNRSSKSSTMEGFPSQNLPVPRPYPLRVTGPSPSGEQVPHAPGIAPEAWHRVTTDTGAIFPGRRPGENGASVESETASATSPIRGAFAPANPVHPRREAERSPGKAPTRLGVTEGIFLDGRDSRGLAPFHRSSISWRRKSGVGCRELIASRREQGS